MADEKVKLDHIDKRILQILQDNAKTPYSKIAEELGISEATVHLRIKKLLQLGVIKRFQAIVDPVKIGKSVTALVAIVASPQRYNDVLQELKKMPEVYEIFDVTGEYYAILKIRVGSREELAKVIDKIGAIPGIEGTKTMFVLRVVKEETRLNIT